MRTLFFFAIFLSIPLSSRAQEPLLQSGDMVALVGNTLIERARLYGEIESALQLAAGPEVTGLRFRNLGWSGDSVYGDSRSYFGEPEEGRERLSTVLTEIHPNVVLLCYGTGAAMSVDQGWTNERGVAETSSAGLDQSLGAFIDGYQALLQNVRKSSGTSLREIVLISPPPLENFGDPLPDQTGNNRNLAVFRNAIRDLAKAEDCRFVDLFAAMGGDDFSGEVANPKLTNNGIHFSEEGYRIVARELAKGLGYKNSDTVDKSAEAVAELRSAIVEKNRLFFHRWRPANETYLFLFRKHEQGQNAKEIPQFDPLIKTAESKIEDVRKVALQGAVKN